MVKDRPVGERCSNETGEAKEHAEASEERAQEPPEGTWQGVPTPPGMEAYRGSEEPRRRSWWQEFFGIGE